MKEKIKNFFNSLFPRKKTVTDNEVALANMLVHHIQTAEQKPTAEIKR